MRERDTTKQGYFRGVDVAGLHHEGSVTLVEETNDRLFLESLHGVGFWTTKKEFNDNGQNVWFNDNSK